MTQPRSPYPKAEVQPRRLLFSPPRHFPPGTPTAAVISATPKYPTRKNFQKTAAQLISFTPKKPLRNSRDSRSEDQNSTLPSCKLLNLVCLSWQCSDEMATCLFYLGYTYPCTKIVELPTSPESATVVEDFFELEITIDLALPLPIVHQRENQLDLEEIIIGACSSQWLRAVALLYQHGRTLQFPGFFSKEPPQSEKIITSQPPPPVPL